MKVTIIVLFAAKTVLHSYATQHSSTLILVSFTDYGTDAPPVSIMVDLSSVSLPSNSAVLGDEMYKQLASLASGHNVAVITMTYGSETS